jgi:tRNA(fMet)-specific endonuclease VapC
MEVLSYDQKTSQAYGQIKAKLENNGEMIDENDIHIAAHAISQGLILVTNNLNEFRKVPHLSLENWV